MAKFNTYYAGVQCPEANDYIRENGLLRLLSYWNDKKLLQTRVELGYQTFLDSGAYTAWTKNTQVDVDKYIKYVNEWDRGLSYFMQVDEIPGKLGVDATPKERLASNIKTWENFLYMYKKVNSPKKLVPVFHAGSDTSRLINILNFEPAIDLIAIGNIVGRTKAEKTAKLTEVFEVVLSSNNPDIKVHALGVQDFTLSQLFPLYSADASSWIQVSANGGIMSDNGVILVSDQSTEKKNHYANMTPPAQLAILEYIKKFGYTMDELSKEYKKRTLFNIKWLDEKSEAYVCQYGKRKKQNSLF